MNSSILLRVNSLRQVRSDRRVSSAGRRFSSRASLLTPAGHFSTDALPLKKKKRNKINVPI